MSRKIPQNQGLLYWFTELCVVEVLQSTPKWSFYVNKMNYDLKTYLLNCGNHCRSRKQRACQPITWPNMISIYCAINDKLSRDNFSFIAQQFMKHLNIWREIPYQSAPKYYSLFIEWVQNSRVCHTASIQNPLKVTIFKEFQCVTVARSLSDRFSYSPAIIDCWPQKRLLMNVKPSNLLISAPAKISQG